jgi:hypothetical protein
VFKHKYKPQLVLFSLLLLSQVTSSVEGLIQESHQPDYTSLSGVWEGTHNTYKMGRCSIDSSDRSVWITLDIAPDGTFKAAVSLRGPKDGKARTWTGQFDKENRFRATETTRAYCGNQKREYKVKYSGKVIEKEGKLWLEIEGKEEACPDQGCIFKVSYRVTKKSNSVFTKGKGIGLAGPRRCSKG